MNLRFIHPNPARWLLMPYTSLSRALAIYALYIPIPSIRYLCLYVFIPRVSYSCLYMLIPRVGYLGSIYSVLAPSLIFSLAYSSIYFLSYIPYHTSSIWILYHAPSVAPSVSHFAYSATYPFLYILYQTSSIRHILSRIFPFTFRICICIFRFAFPFSALHLHFPFRISHFAFRISHQTTHIQWVSHFILLF